MTTNAAIFAKEFYHHSGLFLSGFHVEKLPDGGLRYSTPPFGEFWGNRNVLPTVDEQGKINFVTYSFFERLKYTFSLSPDQNLIAAHHRLKELEAQMQNPLNPNVQCLKQEIHNIGISGANKLEENLRFLNKTFETANGNYLTMALVKINNFFCSIFHWQPIELYDFKPILLDVYKQKAISPALELTPQDHLRCTYSPILQNHSPFPLPPQINRENLQKLELGLLSEISFTFDQKEFGLWFDNRDKEFVLDYLCDASNPSPGASRGRESFTWSAPRLNVVEKKINGSTETHPLQRVIQYSYQENWTGDKWSCAINGGQLRMKMNSEYTIPLSRGNFSIQFSQRS